MPNFAQFFKDEVRRLARKELKSATDRLHADNAGLKKTVSELRRRVAELERSTRKLAKAGGRRAAMDVTGGGEPLPRVRISSKSVRTLRQKLGLTQAEFGKLLGVTGQSVYQWERRNSRLNLRRGPTQRFAEAKTMGVREARRRLEELS